MIKCRLIEMKCILLVRETQVGVLLFQTCSSLGTIYQTCSHKVIQQEVQGTCNLDFPQSASNIIRFRMLSVEV